MTNYSGCVTSLVMTGKPVCPENSASAWSTFVHQKYIGASLYCPHPQYIVHIMGSILSDVKSHHAAPLASEEDTQPVQKLRVLPGDDPARVKEFWCTL